MEYVEKWEPQRGKQGRFLWLLISFSPHDYSIMIVFCAHLQMRKLRQQKVTLHAQDHPVSKWRIQDSLPGGVNTHPRLLTTTHSNRNVEYRRGFI